MTKDKTNIEEIINKYLISHNLPDGVRCKCIHGAKGHLKVDIINYITKGYTPKDQVQAECEDALDFMYAQISINSWEVNGIRETSLHNVAEALKLAKSKFKKEQREHE